MKNKLNYLLGLFLLGMLTFSCTKDERAAPQGTRFNAQPFGLGAKWVYSVETFTDTSEAIVEIIGDTVLGGKPFKVAEQKLNGSSTLGFFYVDPVSGDITQRSYNSQFQNGFIESVAKLGTVSVGKAWSETYQLNLGAGIIASSKNDFLIDFVGLTKTVAGNNYSNVLQLTIRASAMVPGSTVWTPNGRVVNFYSNNVGTILTETYNQVGTLVSNRRLKSYTP